MAIAVLSQNSNQRYLGIQRKEEERKRRMFLAIIQRNLLFK